MAKVLFLQDVWIEYYGLMQLSSLLKKHGHKTDILFASEENTLEAVKRSKPDLIAYSLMSIQWNWLKSMTTYLKKNGINTPQLVGGIHPTMYPDVTINHDGVDIICKGEGDFAMLELCNALDKKVDYSSIKNLWVKKDNEIRQRVSEIKVGEAKNFFDKYDMLECKMQDNILSVKKSGTQQELQFEIHKVGKTNEIMKEAKAFAIDMASVAECTHLTKYFGPYNITKTTENKFIFSKGDQSALLSKSGW